MTDQIDDEEFPPIHFALRNTDGEADTVTLHSHTFGFEPYILVKTGEEGPEIEGSHLTFEEVAILLSFTVAAMIDSGELDDETVETIRELVGEEEA